jgi:hypothetical protein
MLKKTAPVYLYLIAALLIAFSYYVDIKIIKFSMLFFGVAILILAIVKYFRE